jgi:hypothetical protein
MTALSFAAAFILVLLSSYSETEAQYPRSFASAMNSNIVFIGSSLTGHSLPAVKPAHGILGDDRSSTILSVAGISERFSNRLLADAIDSGAETIFLEINAYAHHYMDLAEPAFLVPMVVALGETGAKLTFVVKAFFKVGQNRNHIIQIGARKTDQTLDTEQLRPGDYYRFQKIEPSYGDELQALLARAKDTNVEVFFFSPPRPQSAVSMMGNDEFADLHFHLEHIAALYDVPLWYSPVPWPDDHVMDILAHTNVRGRIRFQKELAQWYGARR